MVSASLLLMGPFNTSLSSKEGKELMNRREMIQRSGMLVCWRDHFCDVTCFGVFSCVSKSILVQATPGEALQGLGLISLPDLFVVGSI